LKHAKTVEVSGTPSSNDGEVALDWVLAGHGLMLRAEWDIARYVRTGRLVILLENHATKPADIFAVHSERQARSPRVRACVDFLVKSVTQSEGKPQGLELKRSMFDRDVAMRDVAESGACEH
jgi:LysR family transcriptional regulator, transcriptional activator for dmlA